MLPPGWWRPRERREHAPALHTLPDLPAMEVAFLPSEEGPAPYGAKPVGEVAVCGPAPAIANAIYDAVGVRVTDLPMTAERVFEALQTRQTDGARRPPHGGLAG